MEVQMSIHTEIKAGDFVTSVSGRDKNRYYVVMTADGKMVEICDGDLHKIDRKKKKNIKHIKPVMSCDETLKEKIARGDKITDSEIRKALKVFKEN
jgi:ribosomal protein L14E/L6E/L27E